MSRRAIFPLMLASALVVAALAYWLVRQQLTSGSTPATAASAPLSQSPPTQLASLGSMSTASADAQRTQHYQDLETLARIRELPSAFARREALFAVAGRAGSTQLGKLIGEAEKLGVESERLAALEILLLRQVELSPPTALRTATSMDRDTASRLVPIVLGAWSQSDPDAAIAAVRQLPVPSMRKSAARAVLIANASRSTQDLRQLAESLGAGDELDEVTFQEHTGELLDDPHQAIVDALHLPPDLRQERLLKIAQAWARVSPEEAWDHAAELDDAGTRMAFQSAVAETWLMQQPEAVFARARELPSGSLRTQLLRDAALELTSRNPQQAIALLAGADPKDAPSLRVVIVDEWARHDVAAAAKWIASLPQDQQSGMSYQIAETYVTQQQDAALAWALSISRSPGRNLWSRMVGIIAQHDLDRALSLAQAAPTSVQRQRATGEIITTLAEHDPQQAIAMMDKLPVGRGRLETQMNVADKMARHGPEVALAWLDTVKEQEARINIAGSLMSSVIERDPEAAAGMLDRVPKDLRPQWLMIMANRYAHADPERGQQWLARLRDDPAYPQALGQFAASLANSNAEAALELVDRAAEGSQRDEVLRRVLPNATASAPEVATRWVDKISDPAQRAAAVQSVAGTWLRTDPLAARKWLLSQPPSAGRDGGLAQAAGSAESADDAIALVDQIQSPEQRMQAVFQSAMSLRRSDPEGARTLLRRRPLDPKFQQYYDAQSQGQPQVMIGY